jgi:DNA-binding transcriptional LysR family regulator
MRVILPRLPKLARDYPDVVLDITVDNHRTDIVANRYDAGIRLGDLIDKDMVSVRVGGDERGVIVASPAYLARHPAPRLPGEIAGHRCIAVRLLPESPVYRWELEKLGRAVQVTPPAALITNDHAGIVAAAVAGLGLAFVLESTVEPLLRDGSLVRVLEDWCPSFPGCFLYYPSRRQVTPAARAIIDALRWKEPASHAKRPRSHDDESGFRNAVPNARLTSRVTDGQRTAARSDRRTGT